MTCFKSCLIPACAAFLAAQALFVPTATAVVIAVPKNEWFFTNTLQWWTTRDLDIDGNGTNDFQILGEHGSYTALFVNGIGQQSSILGIDPPYENDLGSESWPVAFGTLLAIDSSPFAEWGASWHEDDLVPDFPQPGNIFHAGSILYGAMGIPDENGHPSAMGQWRPGNRFAVGLRFLGEDGELHYGWLDVTIGSRSSLYLNGWAYETEPNKLVTPFQIPEPSTTSLVAVLTVGAALRRRR